MNNWAEMTRPWTTTLSTSEMKMEKETDTSRRLGTSAFKEEINHLLHTQHHPGSDGEQDQGWNCRDHALVMAMMLKRAGTYPKIATGKCMYVQGPYLKNNSFEIGQKGDYSGNHNWVIDQKFGVIDVSPNLESKQHRFRAAFNGIYGQVWLPQAKERVKVVVCHDSNTYEQEIDKANRLNGLSTAVYMHVGELQVSDQVIETPFKFLRSALSAEIKKRFGAGFYPAVAKHLHGFMLGKRDSLKHLEKLKAWGVLLDDFPG
jgi:hypothetical protein